MDRLPDLPKICVCIGHGDPAIAESLALASCRAAGPFIELRMDLLDDPSAGIRIVDRVRQRHPQAAILATCRRAGNGGRFAGSIEQQVALLEDAVGAGADLVDIEIETLEECPRAIDPFRDTATTVASYHNFEKTPGLLPVLRRLERTGADIFKVATATLRPGDNLKLLKLCKRRPNMVVAGMGETGVPTRLLGPMHGGLFTYAAPDLAEPGGGSEALPTAPGQISAADVRELYRLARASSSTKMFAVVAKPVGHSMSPRLHNLAFESTGFDGIYMPLLVEPGHLASFFRFMRELPLTGASVTIPHKRGVIRYLDDVDPAAHAIGAVNTLYWNSGRLTGTNTDVLGIVKPLSQRLDLGGSRALVVGTGGAAKAAIVALRQLGAEVFVTGRNPRKVGLLARLHHARVQDFGQLADAGFDVLVQATSVGMLPNVDGNLFPGRVPAEIVFDLVYNPLETALLKNAASQGKTVISGIEMFIEQAAAQFRTWTGAEAPREVMREAVLERTVKTAQQRG